uniref:Ovule protein n=1 Tax=Steinernema glaseri TaxID=37863 RepID=A0A1I7YDB3_9BILA
MFSYSTARGSGSQQVWNTESAIKVWPLNVEKSNSRKHLCRSTINDLGGGHMLQWNTEYTYIVQPGRRLRKKASFPSLVHQIILSHSGIVYNLIPAKFHTAE